MSREKKKKMTLFILNHVTEIVLVLVVVALWIAAPNFMRLNN